MLALGVRMQLVVAVPLLLLGGCKLFSNKQAAVNMQKTCVITVTGTEQLSSIELQRKWGANMEECTMFMNTTEEEDIQDANLE